MGGLWLVPELIVHISPFHKYRHFDIIFHIMEMAAEQRNQKRKEVVEAIVVRQESTYLVSRIYNVPKRTVFNWPALCRSGGGGC